ncbi:recombinase family protein [Solidesulfovibrio fructosivorans]|uniref:recombinase family protein n=1 Tax=Solidesulfovibrio fructosivorans TaxID=878 RepID=UPI0023511E41|nr:recombinase family protein [Solidesulfovibrio fructosivorans]
MLGQGKLIASMMAALAEFERYLLRERVRSGIAAAKARDKTVGRRLGHRPKAELGPQGALPRRRGSVISRHRQRIEAQQEHGDGHRPPAQDAKLGITG